MGKIISVGNIPKLTKEQNRILDEIIHGAEIQSTYENGKVDMIWSMITEILKWFGQILSIV